MDQQTTTLLFLVSSTLLSTFDFRVLTCAISSIHPLTSPPLPSPSRPNRPVSRHSPLTYQTLSNFQPARPLVLLSGYSPPSTYPLHISYIYPRHRHAGPEISSTTHPASGYFHAFYLQFCNQHSILFVFSEIN